MGRGVFDGIHSPNGAIKGFTYGNGIVHTMTQNARQLPSQSTDCTSSGTCATANRRLDLAYAYDKNGNVTQITDGVNGRQTRGMAYDGLDRLVQTTSNMFGTASYAYDQVDNLTRVTLSGGQARDQYYCYDTFWRLANVKTGSCTGATVVSLEYNAQGNVINKSGQAYVFDLGNRLRSATGKEWYAYDGYGRRVLSCSPSACDYQQYANDGNLYFHRDNRASKEYFNIYLGGSLVAIRELPAASGSTATVKYQHTDALGTPIAVTDANKALVQTSEYEPYGQLLNRTLTDGPGFTGQVQDAATGLTYMQQRYYDPVCGCFLSVDPVTAYDKKDMRFFNRYAYAFNNPYRFTDPDGRQSVGEMIDSGAEGCGAISCAGWAAGKALWTVFGAEGVSQVADKGAGASTGDKVMAGIEVGTLGLGGKVGAGVRAIEGAAKWFSPVARMSRQLTREFGVAGSAVKNGSGTVFKLADGKVSVRVMESGGGRTNYLRVSVEGKGSIDATGALSSDRAATHIPINKDSLKLIQDVIKRYTE